MGDVALVMCYNTEGELLLGKRKDNGKWTLPAGHIEDGESPEQAARRELFEEAGLQAASLSPLKTVETPHGALHFFSAYVGHDPHPHSDNDPDEEVESKNWKFVDVSGGLPKAFQDLAGPEDDTNIVRQIFDMQKSEKKGLPKTETCAECSQPATTRVIWAEGMAYQPVCDDHIMKVKARYEAEDEFCGLRPIKKSEGTAGRSIVVTIPRGKLAEVEAEEADVARRSGGGETGITYYWQMGRVPKVQPKRIYFLWDGAVRAYHDVVGMKSDCVLMSTTIHTLPTPIPMGSFRGFRYFDALGKSETVHDLAAVEAGSGGFRDPGTADMIQIHAGTDNPRFHLLNVPIAGLRSLGAGPEKASRYAQHLKDGGKLPPVVVGYNGAILDGNHRVEAHKLVGHTEVPAYVLEGSLSKAEDDEVSTMLRHPNPTERAMALKLSSVRPTHLQTASLDPDPAIHVAAIDHPKFDHAAGMHLMEAQADGAGNPPDAAQRAFLARPEKVKEAHLKAAHKLAGGRLDEVLAAHPGMTPGLIGEMYNDPRVSMQNRDALLRHPAAPDVLLTDAVKMAMLSTSAEAATHARTAIQHPSMPAETLTDLIHAGADPRAPQGVFNLAHFALKNARVPHNVISELLTMGKVSPSAEHASLRAAAASGPSATDADIDEVMKDRNPVAWRGLHEARNLQPRHIDTLLGRLLAESPRDTERLKALFGHQSFGAQHLQRMTQPAEPMVKAEQLAKAVSPGHIRVLGNATDAAGADLVDHTADLHAHPEANGAETEAYRQQVLHSPQTVGQASRAAVSKAKGVSRKAVFKALVPGKSSPSTFMLKPYHEKIIPEVRSYQRHLHQGWSEMTNQALFHAAGLGHLHQKVHVDEHNAGPGREREPMTVTHIEPNHSSVIDYTGTHYDHDQGPDKSAPRPENAENAANVRKIALLSFLGNAQDQHANNFMVNNVTGAPLAIDNARNFQYVAPHRRADQRSEVFASYVRESALGQLDPLLHQVPVAPGSANDLAARRSNAVHKSLMGAIDRYKPAFDWWGEKSPAIRKSFHDRLAQIKDPAVREHLARNFDARADWLDERAKFGIENYGQTWFNDEVPMYRPGEVTDDEQNDPEVMARAKSLMTKSRKPVSRSEAARAARQWLKDQPKSVDQEAMTAQNAGA